jgi:hypothetical protein
VKEVLILTNYFPPCGMTAASRFAYFVENFYRYGIKPIVITRNWERPMSNPLDEIHPSGDTLKTVIDEKGASVIYYLPFSPKLRDRLLLKYGEDRFTFLRKFLLVFERLLPEIFPRMQPHYNLYSFARDYLAKHPEVKTVITTAQPYSFFLYGYWLKKKFPYLQMIADYKDDWNTRSINKWFDHISFGKNVIDALEKRNERKWLADVGCFTTVSENYCAKISAFTGKKGYVVANGYNPVEIDSIGPSELYPEFTITYGGTLIDIQDISIFINGFKRFLVETDPNARIIFLGTGYDRRQKQRIHELTATISKNVSITERMPRKDAFRIMKSSHLLLLVSYNGILGSPSSKIYDYIGLKKKILLCPSDGEIMEEMVSNVDGIICRDEESVTKALNTCHQLIQTAPDQLAIAPDKAALYSREYGLQVLAGLIK